MHMVSVGILLCLRFRGVDESDGISLGWRIWYMP
jgi:hypothetical protein